MALSAEQLQAVKVLQDLETEVDDLVNKLRDELGEYFRERAGRPEVEVEPTQPRPGGVRYPQVTGMSWQDAERAAREAPKKKPRWKGIKGLLKWLWSGSEEEPSRPPLGTRERPSTPTPISAREGRPPREPAPTPKPSEELKGPLRWGIYGQPKTEGPIPRLTLREYIEFEKQMDLLADEIIDDLLSEHVYSEARIARRLRSILNRFRNALKGLIRKARRAIERIRGVVPSSVSFPPEAPPGTPKPTGIGDITDVPTPGEIDVSGQAETEPEEKTDAEIAADIKKREEEEAAAAEAEPKVKPSKLTIKEKFENPDLTTTPPTPELTWFNRWATKTKPQRVEKDPSLGGWLSKKSGTERHVDVLRWLIHKGVNILDKQAVREALEEVTNLSAEREKHPKSIAVHISGNVLGHLLDRLGITNLADKKAFNYVKNNLQKLGWVPGGDDLLNLRNFFVEKPIPSKPAPTGEAKPKPPSPAPKPETSPEEQEELRKKGRRLEELFGKEIEKLMKQADKLPVSEKQDRLVGRLEHYRKTLQGMAEFEPGYIPLLKDAKVQHYTNRIEEFRKEIKKLQAEAREKPKDKPEPKPEPKPERKAEAPSERPTPEKMAEEIKKVAAAGGTAGDKMLATVVDGLLRAIEKGTGPTWSPETNAEKQLEGLYKQHVLKLPEKPKPKAKPKRKPKSEKAKEEIEIPPETEEKLEKVKDEIDELKPSPRKDDLKGMVSSLVDQIRPQIEKGEASLADLDHYLDEILTLAEKERGRKTGRPALFKQAESHDILQYLPSRFHKTYYLLLLRD